MTIAGSNLGVTVHDVTVFVGMNECILIQSDYNPGKAPSRWYTDLSNINILIGKEIVCTTSGVSSEGDVVITVRIWRAQTELTATYNSFEYVLPKIISVYPRYGPVSGGTLVTISGSALDAGNTEEITVFISEEICSIV